MDLREFTTGIDEGKHWYYRTKSIPLLRYFEKCVTQKATRLHLLDIGAGSGFFSQVLLQRFDACIDGVVLVDAGYTQEGISRNKLDRVQKVTALPDTISNSFILMMDVLEHLADDRALLAEIRKRTKGRNYFFATVPAFNFMWSSHDEFLGHHRRYSRTGLVDALCQNGFAMERAYYLYASIFPLVFLLRKLRPKSTPSKSDLRPAHPFTNTLLKSVIGIEARVARINTLFGLTCIAEGSIVT
jgi:SAM-dependent methyltransferase